MSTRTNYYVIDDVNPDDPENVLAEQAFSRLESVAIKHFDGDTGWSTGLLVLKNRLIVIPDPDNDREPWDFLKADLVSKWKPEEYVANMVKEAMLSFCLDAEVKGLNVYFPNESMMQSLELLPTNELIQLTRRELAANLLAATKTEIEGLLEPPINDAPHSVWKRFWDFRRFSKHYTLFEQSDFKPFTTNTFDPHEYRFFDLRGNDAGDNFDETQHGLVTIEVRT
jgi:hypothetical protein